MASPEAEWHQALGQAVNALEMPEFPAILVAALHHVALFDYCVIFGYAGSGRPADLYDDFGPRRRDIFVSVYQSGPYLLDPFYHASRQRIQAGLYRLRELAPDRFYQSEYYRSYYIRTGLAEEIGFVIHPNDAATIVMSLMRAGHRTLFATRELRHLRAVAPVIIALAGRHWRDFAEPASHGARHPDPAMLPSFELPGQPRLTRREGEVVSLVLRGHSSVAIAQELGIAAGTVKIHRKNIYAKLGLSSQAELFSLFLSSVARPGD